MVSDHLKWVSPSFIFSYSFSVHWCRVFLIHVLYTEMFFVSEYVFTPAHNSRIKQERVFGQNPSSVAIKTTNIDIYMFYHWFSFVSYNLSRINAAIREKKDPEYAIIPFHDYTCTLNVWY